MSDFEQCIRKGFTGLTEQSSIDQSDAEQH